ncbi:SAM-dependent methyltransferase [Nitrosotalea devaniterrae]|uniref:SAM-dependent methyltransferase n=1 Tax=Nitrosotalea devaniterrae TaxID=1078905 RepID=A0A128A0P5_9ARCH|nr:SAM-dependent methyltransferase [Candidatus Nitrosotalea devanaterra]
MVSASRSRLDEIYSLSSKITGKEFVELVAGGPKIFEKALHEFTKYIDPYTGKVKNEFAIIRDKCPLCFSKDFGYAFTKDGFDHMICNSCDMIFTLQILDNDKTKYLEEGEEGDAYGEIKEKPAISENDKKKYEIVFEEIGKYGKVKDILDIGSQIGTFVQWASDKGFNIIGHEYHNPLRKVAQSRGLTVLNDNLEKITFDKQFDLITMWDYIDHVIGPHEVIKNLTKYLKKGGLFFYAINNRDSLSAKILHQYCPNFIGPHHTMHYGISQLQKLMGDDFELLEYESYVSELNWISNWMSFKSPWFGDAPLAYELFDPKKICELGMGIKLNAIFRKK